MAGWYHPEDAPYFSERSAVGDQQQLLSWNSLETINHSSQETRSILSVRGNRWLFPEESTGFRIFCIHHTCFIAILYLLLAHVSVPMLNTYFRCVFFFKGLH